MADATDQVRKLIDELKQQRDELRVKLHLAKADARDEWELLEKQWEQVLAKLEVAREEAGRTAQGVGSALRLAAEEIKRGYDRIRQRM